MENDDNRIAIYEKQIAELSLRVQELEKKTYTKKMMIFLISGSLDRAISAFMIANWAVAMGYQVNMYFTLWALNLLRNKTDLKQKTLLEKMANLMMKRGPDKAILSQMHMLGMGTLFMKQLMKEHNFSSLDELMKAANEMGIQFYACHTMMGIMGVKEEELFENVKVLGGLDYIQHVSESSVNFVI